MAIYVPNTVGYVLDINTGQVYKKIIALTYSSKQDATISVNVPMSEYKRTEVQKHGGNKTFN